VLVSRQFEHKVALVTGGNAGIGRETALAFAAQGAQVIVAARREREGEETAALIRARGGEGHFIATDVTQPASVRALVEACERRYGRLDLAFNNAGITGGTSAPVDGYDIDVFDEVVAVNLRGVFLCMKFEIGCMLRTGGGCIVNCSSTAALKAVPLASAYSASKLAVIGLTKSAALEYAARGIRINAVCPGLIYTDLIAKAFAGAPAELDKMQSRIPIGRAGEASEIAGAVLWLCSAESSYVTGTVLSADGGATA
jgi:NAD(P)-dependent dehydrogenase (short-subunit alcohol dehydrogenase family)